MTKKEKKLAVLAAIAAGVWLLVHPPGPWSGETYPYMGKAGGAGPGQVGSGGPGPGAGIGL